MRLALILLPLLVVALAVGFIAWKIGGLKQRLVAELESALHADAAVGALNLDLGQGELLATNITLQNRRPGAPWDDAVIDQAAIHFHLADVLGSTMPMQVEINGWKATLHTTASAGSSASTAGSPEQEAPAPGVGVEGTSRARVTQVTATNGDVTVLLGGNQSVAVHGVSFQASTPGGPTWTTHLQVGSISAGTLLTGPGSADIHSDGADATFNDLALRCGDGQIAGSGDLALAAPHALRANFTANAVPVTMLVAVRWQMKISGLVSGTLRYQGDDDTGAATGQLAVAGGRFSLFPWLGKATMLVGLPDITNMTVDQATASYSWKNHLLSLQDIDLRKTDLFRISGQADIAADDTLDAHLKLGLPMGAVAKWPKLQTDVFNQPLDNFAWTDVHVTGTPDSPQEDLTPRLLAVGAEQGTDLLQQTKDKATQLLNQLLK